MSRALMPGSGVTRCAQCDRVRFDRGGALERRAQRERTGRCVRFLGGVSAIAVGQAGVGGGHVATFDVVGLECSAPVPRIASVSEAASMSSIERGMVDVTVGRVMCDSSRDSGDMTGVTVS